MESIITLNSKFNCSTVNKGLLNSSYKRTVEQNFSSQSQTSVFGIRQRIKSHRLNTIYTLSVMLKLAAFVALLFAIN